MVYDVIKKISGKNYLYLVQNVRLISGKSKKITKYLGLAEKFKKEDIKNSIKENQIYFNKKELEIRLEQINSLKIGYNYQFFDELEKLNSKFQLKLIEDIEKQKKNRINILKIFYS